MSVTANKQKFDFNEWSRLAAEDPETFETRRQDAIEQAISKISSEKQQRMRSLQWRIDKERERSKTPMAACIKLSNMMWENVLGDHGLLATIRHVETNEVSRPVLNTGKILPFKSRQH